MQAITASLHKTQQTLLARHSQSVQTLLSALTNDTSPQQAKPEEAPALTKQEERVLEIDVIESSYIPRTQENIPEPPKHELPIPEESHSHKEKRKFQAIQSEKRAILDQLRRIDEEIAVIKGQPAQDVNLKRRQKEAEEQRARKQAQQLVKQLKKEKKGLQERKRQEQEKKLQLLKQEEEEIRHRRKEEEERAKEERRKAIEQRMEQERRKREQRKQMDKESNRLLVQLRREDELLKAKQEIPAQTNQLEQKKRVVQKRQDVNFREIQEHERRYIVMKEQEKLNRRDRSESQSHPIPKYQKNTWIEKIEEEEFKRKEEEKIKELQRKNQLEKRLKYGQLVKNIFLPKKKEDKSIPTEDPPKPHTPNAPSLPKIADSDKRVTQNKTNKHFTEHNRPFATAHNYKKPPRAPKIQPAVEEPVIEDEGAAEKERERKQRELQLRRQTKERLKKLQNQSLDLLPKSKPKYENYLGQVKQKRKEETWKDIIDNGKLSKEQKYAEMLKQANSLQTRAKQKEQFRKQGDEEAVNLYINSIQAKLALLEKF